MFDRGPQTKHTATSYWLKQFGIVEKFVYGLFEVLRLTDYYTIDIKNHTLIFKNEKGFEKRNNFY